MSLIHLETPVLVQQREGRFRLQPLLMSGPSVERKRYRDAEQAFRKAIIEAYKERALDRSEMDELLWLSLKARLHFELMPLAFKSGLHHIEGLFALVRYGIRDRDYLWLPRLEQLTVQLPNGLNGRNALVAFVEETVQGFLRRKRQAQEKDPLDHRPYFSQAGDSLVDVTLDFHIENNPYPFEWEGRELFSLMGRDQLLDGAQELGKVAEDWNDRYPGRLQTALFRDGLRQRLHLALYGKHPTPTVLVAPTGSGKTNLVQGLVRWHIEQAPQRPPHRRVKLWLVDPLRVISGMSIVGQWERRWEAILEQLRSRLPKTVAIHRPDILYVDNPVALLHIGKSAQTHLTLAHLLRPYLEERRLPCLLEATPQQWQRIQELDRGFADLFQVIRLPALDAGHQLKVIVSGRARLENEHRCRIETAALTSLLKLEPQFRGDQALPGSALGPLAQIAQRHQEGTARHRRLRSLPDPLPFSAGHHRARHPPERQRDRPLLPSPSGRAAGGPRRPARPGAEDQGQAHPAGQALEFAAADRAHRGGQDRIGQALDRVSVRARGVSGAHRSQRVCRRGRRGPPDRRQRQPQRHTHRAGALPARLRAPARRAGEGAPQGPRPAAAAARRRPPDRRPGQDHGFRSDGGRHDLQPRRPGRGKTARLQPGRQRPGGHLPPGGGEFLPPGIPQPDRPAGRLRAPATPAHEAACHPAPGPADPARWFRAPQHHPQPGGRRNGPAQRPASTRRWAPGP